MISGQHRLVEREAGESGDMEKGCGAPQGRGHLAPQVNGDGFEDVSAR